MYNNKYYNYYTCVICTLLFPRFKGRRTHSCRLYPGLYLVWFPDPSLFNSRRFSSYSNAEVMLKLYLTIVRPHLDYAAQVWHPYQAKNITALENVQKFALRICSRSYDTNYQDLLDCYHLPSLENRRIYLSLCTFYKIVNSIIFSPSIIYQ